MWLGSEIGPVVYHRQRHWLPLPRAHHRQTPSDPV